jgi:hypothetical protein
MGTRADEVDLGWLVSGVTVLQEDNSDLGLTVNQLFRRQSPDKARV